MPELCRLARQAHSCAVVAPFETGPDKGCYYHEKFLRGKPWLARHIHRIKVKGQGPRRPSSQEIDPNFYAMPFLPEPARNGAVAGAPLALSAGTTAQAAASAAAAVASSVNENVPSLSDAATMSLLLGGSGNASNPSSNIMIEALSTMSNLGVATRSALQGSHSLLSPASMALRHWQELQRQQQEEQRLRLLAMALRSNNELLTSHALAPLTRSSPESLVSGPCPTTSSALTMALLNNILNR
jgi:hypothetical protein